MKVKVNDTWDDSEDTFHEKLGDELKEFWDEWYNTEEDYEQQ